MRLVCMFTPALTGVDWPAFEAGRLAARILIEHLATGGHPPRQLLIGGELVVRESTGPPVHRSKYSRSFEDSRFSLSDS